MLIYYQNIIYYTPMRYIIHSDEILHSNEIYYTTDVVNNLTTRWDKVPSTAESLILKVVHKDNTNFVCVIVVQ